MHIVHEGDYPFYGVTDLQSKTVGVLLNTRRQEEGLSPVVVSRILRATVNRDPGSESQEQSVALPRSSVEKVEHDGMEVFCLGTAHAFYTPLSVPQIIRNLPIIGDYCIAEVSSPARMLERRAEMFGLLRDRSPNKYHYSRFSLR